MSKKLIEMKIVRKLILLLQRGLSERRIARELRISRPSVGRFRERLVASGKNLEELLGLPGSYTFDYCSTQDRKDHRRG